MGDRVIEFKPSREMEAAVSKSRPRRRKKREETSRDLDPNLGKIGRVYEITYYDATAEHVVVTKWRIRTTSKKGLEDSVYSPGGNADYYFGMVSEHVGPGRDKWSPYTWGWLPVNLSFVREIVEEPKKPTPIKQEPKKDETKNEQQG